MKKWGVKLVFSAILLIMMFAVNDRFSNCCSLSHGIEIRSATLLFENGNAALNSDIDFHFSETALVALDNGVSLPLNIELVVKSQRQWMWNKTEWRIILPYQIRYLALSKSYEVINELSGSRRSFASRTTAIDALGRIRAMPVANSGCPSENQQCALFMRVALDRERLPLPLRPIAYTRLDWYLSSRWKQWLLTS
ncbi:MAG: DUF4390 domain-containing protein [Methylococcales bacterium]